MREEHDANLPKVSSWDDDSKNIIYTVMMKRINKGFSLIELLVVVSIVGIISTLGLTAYGRSQSRARDAKRQASVKDIMTAIDQMYATNNSYPSHSAGCSSLPGLASYFPQGIPKDPKTGQDYGCWAGLSLSAYCIESIVIENQNQANCLAGCLTCAASGCAEDEFGNYHYCNWSQLE